MLFIWIRFVFISTDKTIAFTKGTKQIFLEFVLTDSKSLAPLFETPTTISWLESSKTENNADERQKALINTLKVNIGLSLVGVISGEFLVSKAGLGYLIVYGGQVFKLDLVMTSVIILGILAGIMYGGVLLLEKFILKTKKFK